MRMILCPLFSGSGGNATLVCLGDTRLLVDAGVSASRILKALSLLGVAPESISGILVTHEHIDHIKGLPVFVKKTGVPVYANAGTWQGILAKDGRIPHEMRRVITTGEDFIIGGVNTHPFAIPHDAADPVGYVFSRNGGKLGVATDLGYLSDSWLAQLHGCQALVLESNHDVDMLRKGSYPEQLKRRILSRKGHLCNEDSARALVTLALGGTQAAFLAHLSGENNQPELALSCAERALVDAGILADGRFFLGMAKTDGPSEVISLVL
ncbi:MAG: MBL fold metallo-hydrolase [Clostridiales bacterium]|nr:MBL fold metallo-hydrolase [Clostridiales bacterium]